MLLKKSYVYTIKLINTGKKTIISFLIIEISLSIKSWIPYIQGCFVCVEFGWNSPVVVEIKIYKFCQCVFALSLSSPLGVTLHLNTWKVTWISLCHNWLKFVQWFDLKKICCQCTSIFAMISHKKRAFPFIFTKLDPLYPRMLCAKFC